MFTKVNLKSSSSIKTNQFYDMMKELFEVGDAKRISKFQLNKELACVEGFQSISSKRQHDCRLRQIAEQITGLLVQQNRA